MMWACEKQQQYFKIKTSKVKTAEKKYSKMMSYYNNLLMFLMTQFEVFLKSASQNRGSFIFEWKTGIEYSPT